MDVIVAGIAVLAFAATVLVLTGAGRRLQRGPTRTIVDPVGEDWMTISQVAVMLDVPEADVTTLIDRDAIPHFLVSGGNPSHPGDYRFRRDEIDAWTIG
jgi:hypothetical protein